MKNISQLNDQTRNLFHQYREKGFFKFLGTNLARIIFLYAILVIAIILVEKFLLDFNAVFHRIFEKFSDGEVILTLLLSESIIGLLPPEVYMVWSTKFNYPIVMLCALGAVSYVGAILAYQIGFWLSRRNKIRIYIEKRLRKYIRLIQKWGGAFIIIAAIFPFTPYATVIVAVSLLKYPFHKFLIFGLFRILRFLIQGIILVKFINLGI